MTPKQIRELAETMRDCGISHLKFKDLEMSCQAGARPSIAPEVEKVSFVPSPVASIQDPPVEAGPPLEEEEVPHNVQQLASLLKLSDIELVDQLFPEPKEPGEESA
jgi:hypothetical protein